MGIFRCILCICKFCALASSRLVRPAILVGIQFLVNSKALRFYWVAIHISVSVYIVPLHTKISFNEKSTQQRDARWMNIIAWRRCIINSSKNYDWLHDQPKRIQKLRRGEEKYCRAHELKTRNLRLRNSHIRQDCWKSYESKINIRTERSDNDISNF